MPAQGTLLEIVSDVAVRISNIGTVTAVMSSVDPQVVQLRALLEEGLDDLVGRGPWQELRIQATWTTVASEDQGALEDLFPDGYNYMVPETLWDQTNKLALVGPMAPMDWAALQAWVVQGPRYQFMLEQGHFWVNPAPSAGWTWAATYMSEFGIRTAVTAGDELVLRFEEDDDIVLLPRRIVEADLKWRWKKEKKLDYTEDFNTCERMVVDALARSNPRKVVHLDGPPSEIGPRIVIPAGNWPL